MVSEEKNASLIIIINSKLLKMKSKLTFTAICLFIAIQSIQAQKGYTISPSKTLTVSTLPNNLAVFDIYMNNITGSTITISWKKISIDAPAGWDYSLCDLGTCYGAIPDSATMQPVIQGDKGFLGFNVDPKSSKGTLTATFYVYEAGKFSNGDTCTFIISSNGTGIQTVALPGLQLYPNPVAEQLHITIPDCLHATVSLMTASGATLSEQIYTGGSEMIDVSTLSNGIYLVKIVKDGQVYFSRFTKY